MNSIEVFSTLPYLSSDSETSIIESDRKILKSKSTQKLFKSKVFILMFQYKKKISKKLLEILSKVQI